jgi:plasmid stabilization system protein ParE
MAAAFQLLGDTPGIGHSRKDLTNDPVKFWQVFSYFVIYDPMPRPINIIRVLHTSRDLARLPPS